MDARDTLKTFIETELLAGMGATSLGYQDDLLLSGLVNSLGVMRLVTFTQQHFGVEIPMEDVVIENFQSIDAIAAYVQTRQPS
jgi:acyl carrier protein